jgi:hypothetical protein
LIAIALVVAWTIAALLVLFAYRPGGPLDIAVGITLLGPIVIAVIGGVWPPIARGTGAFPAMIALGLGSLLLLLPSISGVADQIGALGSQTLLPSLEAAYPWLLALAGTSLFAGFGVARRLLGGTALRPRRLALGVAIGMGLTLVAGAAFAGVAIANEVALRDRPGSATGSRFGPTDLDGEPLACTDAFTIGQSARFAAHLTGPVDLRPIGSVEQGGLRNGQEFRWLAYLATADALGWAGEARAGDLVWARNPGRGWNLAAPDAVANVAFDVQAMRQALTEGYRATAEDRGVEVIEGAPGRRCRIAVDGATFQAAFPQVEWLVGDIDVSDWRGQLDYWVFLDGQVGQIAGSLNGPAEGLDDAVQGTVEVLLTSTERGRDLVIYPPVR